MGEDTHGGVPKGGGQWAALVPLGHHDVGATMMLMPPPCRCHHNAGATTTLVLPPCWSNMMSVPP